ncbi:Bud site selection protein 6, partial [Friedmanniomyces endolithicus]
MATEDPQRSSAGSSRASAGRSSRQNPQQQLSTIEKSVTHLLVATKQLLETLTMLSRATSTESEVSDVY